VPGQSLRGTTFHSTTTTASHPDVAPSADATQIGGPAMYRMAIGHAGLTPADADAVVATAMRALALSSTEYATWGRSWEYAE
jgi:hypothetical protein